jgi:uncharacterized protein (DUF952 family)
MVSQDSLIHVTTAAAWENTGESGRYFPPGYEAEGFIHCCHRSQLETVLGNHFSSQDEVLLLTLNPGLVTDEIRYETAANGDDYPHIYGSIPSAAVIESVLATRVDGTWRLP